VKMGVLKAELMGANMVMLTLGWLRELVYPVLCRNQCKFHFQAQLKTAQQRHRSHQAFAI